MTGVQTCALPISTTPASEELAASLLLGPPNEQQLTGLSALHLQAVEQFIALPAFGGDRMIIRIPLNDVVSSPLSSSEAYSTAKKEATTPKKDIHLSFREVLTKNHPGVVIQGEAWKLKEVQLVGLSVHSNPVVYETDQVPGMKGVFAVPTRDLNSFETRALDSLKQGKSLKFERGIGVARMMGPIYAGKKCLSCHEQPGQLLGAFSYVLERTPAGEVPLP